MSVLHAGKLSFNTPNLAKVYYWK